VEENGVKNLLYVGKVNVMKPRVVNVIPERDYTLRVWFTNGEVGIST
jgi:hypothetical protein